jgi:thiol-disulfide isomerase/thioredoxin
MRFFLILFSWLVVCPLVHAAPLQQVQPWLGIEVDATVPGGVKAKRVIKSTPAERAGLQDGDLITSIDAEKVKSREELMAVLRAKGVGTKVLVNFLRKEKAEKRELKLEILPDMLDLAKAQLIDKPSPAFEVKAIQGGKAIKRADLLGKVYILEFWATWCPACRAAAPFISKWAAAHPSIPVIGISDEEASVIEAFVKREKLGYQFATDPSGKIQGDFAMGSIPAFILIDKKGFVKDISVGVGEYLETFLNNADALDKKKS